MFSALSRITYSQNENAENVEKVQFYRTRGSKSIYILQYCEMTCRDFLAGVSELLQSFVQIDTLPNNVLIECLLYGDKNLTDDVNRSILELTLEFIHRTGRFD